MDPRLRIFILEDKPQKVKSAGCAGTPGVPLLGLILRGKTGTPPGFRFIPRWKERRIGRAFQMMG
jgi:hypothetical protein